MNTTSALNPEAHHLDLGCGAIPRNPYYAENLYGVDVRSRLDEGKKIKFSKANLIFEKIPYVDNTFDSVSTYDFLEHIPRVIFINGDTAFSFINLMNEIYRVLKPNGKFYAITPVYPKESGFVDPTHVNFITQNTHKYFTYPHNWASMYGFEGSFSLMQSKLVNFDLEVNKRIWYKLIAKRILSILNIKSRQHIKWEFCALK